MHDDAEEQAFGIYQNVALLAFDLLARIVTVPVDRRPSHRITRETES